jgi:hypothetical protein
VEGAGFCEDKLLPERICTGEKVFEQTVAYTYMLGHVGALRDVGTSSVGKVVVPDKILSAVKATPVPVSTHDCADEVGIILVRGRVVEQVAALDVGGGSDHGRGGESEQNSERLHDGCWSEKEG